MLTVRSPHTQAVRNDGRTYRSWCCNKVRRLDQLSPKAESCYTEALERALTIKQTLVPTDSSGQTISSFWKKCIPKFLKLLTLITKPQKRKKKEKKSFPILPVFHLWSSLSSKCRLATSQRTFLLLVLGQEYEQVEYPELPLFYSSDLPVLEIKTKQKNL